MHDFAYAHVNLHAYEHEMHAHISSIHAFMQHSPACLHAYIQMYQRTNRHTCQHKIYENTYTQTFLACMHACSQLYTRPRSQWSRLLATGTSIWRPTGPKTNLYVWTYYICISLFTVCNIYILTPVIVRTRPPQKTEIATIIKQCNPESTTVQIIVLGHHHPPHHHQHYQHCSYYGLIPRVKSTARIWIRTLMTAPTSCESSTHHEHQWKTCNTCAARIIIAMPANHYHYRKRQDKSWQQQEHNQDWQR